MSHHDSHHQTHPRLQRIREQAGRHHASQPEAPSAMHPDLARLTLSVQLVNRLFNEQSHRPDAVRLLREILRERAIRQEIRNWDANSLFG